MFLPGWSQRPHSGVPGTLRGFIKRGRNEEFLGLTTNTGLNMLLPGVLIISAVEILLHSELFHAATLGSGLSDGSPWQRPGCCVARLLLTSACLNAACHVTLGAILHFQRDFDGARLLFAKRIPKGGRSLARPENKEVTLLRRELGVSINTN